MTKPRNHVEHFKSRPVRCPDFLKWYVLLWKFKMRIFWNYVLQWKDHFRRMNPSLKYVGTLEVKSFLESVGSSLTNLNLICFIIRSIFAIYLHLGILLFLLHCPLCFLLLEFSSIKWSWSTFEGTCFHPAWPLSHCSRGLDRRPCSVCNLVSRGSDFDGLRMWILSIFL